MKRRPLGFFCRLDPVTGGVDTALVDALVNGKVLYTVIDCYGNEYGTCHVDEETFMSRWFHPKNDPAFFGAWNRSKIIAN